jgi:galactose mutarotase-like enzyme
MSSLEADLIVDLDNGCRIASLRVGGHELLVTTGRSPIEWGLYPMAPFAGRIRDGSFTYDGTRYELPRTLNGHAIHGTVYLQEWEPDDDTTFVTDLGSPWPFPGFVRQEIRLDDDSLRLRLEIHATEGAMPASCGWHPWFRRIVDEAVSHLEFRPSFMLLRDQDGIATLERAEVPEGPWDDCFGGVASPPALVWPDVLRMQMTADCDWWVVYNERDYATCVEPQTAPPDALNNDPYVVEPGHPLVANATLQWTKPK